MKLDQGSRLIIHQPTTCLRRGHAVVGWKAGKLHDVVWLCRGSEYELKCDNQYSVGNESEAWTELTPDADH